MKKQLFTLLLVAACLTATAQSDIDYPYNPDFENDGFVGIEDVLELLSVYGTPFTPEQLLLDGASLTEIIESLQSQIDSLASYTNEGFGAIALNDSLLTEYLVGVAAASEEGDSTLGAWVMQLSELVEQQQVQLDSISTATEGGEFYLECTEMGVAWNCTDIDEGQDNYSLTPSSGHVFPLQTNCSCDAGVPSQGPTWRKFVLGGYPLGQELKLLLSYSSSSNSGGYAFSQTTKELEEEEEGYVFYVHTSYSPPNNGPCPTNGLPVEELDFENNISVHSVGGYSQSEKWDMQLQVVSGFTAVGPSYFLDFGF